MIPHHKKKTVVMGVAGALFLLVVPLWLPVQTKRLGQIASGLSSTFFAQIIDHKKDEATSQLRQVRLGANAVFGAMASTTQFMATSTPARDEVK